jgi:NAD(P)-dependent dehydrogenase (short-subunit alcohol dehydrogenase family)
MRKTWFITGAGRGLGTDIAKAALKAGDRVVATARRRDRLTAELGADGDRLQTVALDVTDPKQVQAGIDAAVAKFGGIDVLVNNAGYGHLGFFEEASEADIRTQFETNLFGAFHVTRAALPVMRAARKGRIFNLSSVGGLRGNEFGSLYCATKFALEGFSESLALEVAPFGIHVTIIEPGSFRTDFLTAESLRFNGKPIADYAEAMVKLANEEKPPLRFVAGAFAADAAKAKIAAMGAEFDRWRDLALATDYPA